MNFFEEQEKAQRRTWLLFLLFVGAVLFILLVMYASITMLLFSDQLFQPKTNFFEVFWDTQRFYWIVSITLCVIMAGSIYKTQQLLRGGGAEVAEMLGGQRLLSHVKTPLEKRTLNIVEEMAIASGLPVPPVYVLHQSGINAFAAGFSPSDAVLGITQGAMELLSRDELQGVVAHEFSHILHGDMRINMHMMGLLHGITLISDTGMVLLTSRFSARRSRGDKRGSFPIIVVLGLVLFVVGLLGMIIADLIKLAISRQREFLADASAVQFTRNPEGIAGALKVMGGYKNGSQIRHTAVAPVRHFFFAHAAKPAQQTDAMKTNWWATHPPLLARIRRIEPRFRGRLKAVDAQQKRQHVLQEASMGFAQASVSEYIYNQEPADWVVTLGNPDAVHLPQARKLLAAIPARIRDFAHDVYTARAVCYALLLDGDAQIRRVQMRLLEQSADANVMRELLDIQNEVRRLDAGLRLPLLDMLLPALKSLSKAQYQQFIKHIQLLIKADHRVDIFEYTLQYILLRHLKPSFVKVSPVRVRYKKVQNLEVECACTLALLIDLGAHQETETLFAEQTESLLGYAMPWPPSRARQASYLNQALLRLNQASLDIKKRFLATCSHIVLSDGRLNVKEMEALRAIAEAIDCPVPPINSV